MTQDQITINYLNKQIVKLQQDVQTCANLNSEVEIKLLQSHKLVDELRKSNNAYVQDIAALNRQIQLLTALQNTQP